ncbi:MAG: hypothetical protein N3B16_01360 [Candidatus Aminicenantes bacterium]|nr:hypothetical protein [Candidatus Aminicenantes bacterium]
MVKKKILLILGLLFFPWIISGQTIIGQYEEEAPLKSWNISGFIPASGLGRAEIMTIRADNPAVAFSNPSLLTDLPRLSLFFNGSINQASLFRFAIVNTGVLKSNQNLWVKIMALDGAGLALKLNSWSLSFGAAIKEYYDRPTASAESISGGKTTYRINFNQEGFLRTYNFSLARKIGNFLAVGLSFNYSQGKIKRKTEEAWPLNQISILDSKEGSLKDLYLRFGLKASITNSLKISLTFEPSHKLTKESQSRVKYSAETTKTVISIEDEAKDFLMKPFQISLAGSYLWKERWLLLAEAIFFNWSKYKLTWFSQEETRNFRDILRLAAALETSQSLTLFHQSFILITRVGFLIDPQPMKIPRSTYYGLTSGLGLHWKWLRLDLGASWSQEKGSGSSLQTIRSALALNALF